MNTTDHPDVVLGPADSDQSLLPLVSEGVQRWVWHGRFGVILIEVIDGKVLVNGERVESHVP